MRTVRTFVYEVMNYVLAYMPATYIPSIITLQRRVVALLVATGVV